MKMEDIYKLLKVDTLDESQQTTIKEKLDDIIDVKARERADSMLEEDKKALVEEYEVKFEDYKKDITSKFSNFVDSVLDEELKIPEKVLHYAKIGEEYQPLIEQFKVKMAIDEGVLTDEVKSILKEAKEEIQSLKSELNKATAEKMELTEDAKEMAVHIYLRKKCDGLVEAQRTKVLSLLGDIKTVAEIDKKFKIVMEELEGLPQTFPAKQEEPTAEAATNANECPKCGAVATPKGEETIVNCPKCGAKMKDVADMDKAEEMGQGQTQVTDPPEADGKADIPEGGTKLENTDYFEANKDKWLKILKENKI